MLVVFCLYSSFIALVLEHCFKYFLIVEGGGTAEIYALKTYIDSCFTEKLSKRLWQASSSCLRCCMHSFLHI